MENRFCLTVGQRRGMLTVYDAIHTRGAKSDEIDTIYEALVGYGACYQSRFINRMLGI